MATLTEGVKRFIVQALACYDSPTTVADSVKEEFGLDIARTQVAQYDPTKQAGAGLGKKWIVLFEDTRKRFREEAADIPIAQRAFRLRTLDRLAAKAEKMRNFPLTLQVLEQAAKEVGESYVNKTRADGGNGPRTIKIVNSPDED